MGVKDQFEITHQVSCITHRHIRSKMACGIYIQFAINLLKGENPETAYKKMKNTVLEYYKNNLYTGELRHFKRILESDISGLHEEFIKSTGYVVDTLEASLWCFLNNNSYSDTVITAVNLGDDTDTTGSVTGGLAGIYYGYEGLPQKWISKIVKVEEIIKLGEKLYQAICGV